MTDETGVLALAEAVEPPEGYELDGLIAATYSLDLGVALGLPLACIRHGRFAGMEVGEGSRWAVIEAMRTLGTKYRVFCDPGGIAIPPGRLQRVAQLLGAVVIPVAKPHPTGGAGGRPSFHPKFIVARFTRRGTRPRLRLVCMSRNLTADSSLDVGVVLDGIDTGRPRSSQGSHRLASALALLAEWAPSPHQTAETKALVDSLGRSVNRTEWMPPAGFESVKLWPLGFDSEADPMLPDADETAHLVISPFLSGTRLQQLRGADCSSKRESVVVSSAEELEHVGSRGLRGYTAHAFGGYEVDVGDAEEDRPSSGEAGSGLHAKVYVFEGRDRRRIVLGSANATTASVERNAELVIECSGKATATAAFSMKNLLDAESDLGRFVVPWKAGPDDKQPSERPPRNAAESFLRELVACGATAELVELDANSFDLRVELDDVSRLSMPTGAEIQAQMGGSKVEAFLPIGGPAAVFRGLLRRDVGAFLSLTVELDGETCSRLLPLKVSGLSLQDLQTELIRESTDHGSVLAYIGFILEGLEVGGEVEIDYGTDEPSDVVLVDAPGEGSVGLEQSALSIEKLIRLGYEARTSEDARVRMQDVDSAVRAYEEELPTELVEAWKSVMGSADRK